MLHQTETIRAAALRIIELVRGHEPRLDEIEAAAVEIEETVSELADDLVEIPDSARLSELAAAAWSVASELLDELGVEMHEDDDDIDDGLIEPPGNNHDDDCLVDDGDDDDEEDEGEDDE